MSDLEEPNIFWEIHSGLPREGPGDNSSTRKAFSMATELPARPRVLDVGCGPGSQTVELARLSGGQITAIDTHQPFLDDLRSRAAAAGVSSQIEAANMSMFSMPFADQSFDLIWSEGAIYFIGFRSGLNSWKRFLAPAGYLAVTEPCWLSTDLPDAVKDLWADYSGMATIEDNQKIIKECGLAEVGNFVLPASAWWDDYYTPMLAKVTQLRTKYAGRAGALRQIDEAEREIDVYRRHEDRYGYVFFVVRAPSSGSRSSFPIAERQSPARR